MLDSDLVNYFGKPDAGDPHVRLMRGTVTPLLYLTDPNLAIILYDEKRNLNDCCHDYQKKPSLALKLIQKAMTI